MENYFNNIQYDHEDRSNTSLTSLGYIFSPLQIQHPYRILLSKDHFGVNSFLTLENIMELIRLDGVNLLGDNIRIHRKSGRHSGFFKLDNSFKISINELANSDTIFLVEKEKLRDFWSEKYYEILNEVNKVNKNIERYFRDLNPDDNEVDFAILYSDPIVKKSSIVSIFFNKFNDEIF